MNSETLSLKTINKRIGFVKEGSYYSMKLLKKRFVIACNQTNRYIPDPSNTKEYYNSHLKRKKYRIGKTIKSNYSTTKNF